MFAPTVDKLLSKFKQVITDLDYIKEKETLAAEVEETQASLCRDAAKGYRAEAKRAEMLAHKFNDFIMV